MDLTSLIRGGRAPRRAKRGWTVFGNSGSPTADPRQSNDRAEPAIVRLRAGPRLADNPALFAGADARLWGSEPPGPPRSAVHRPQRLAGGYTSAMADLDRTRHVALDAFEQTLGAAGRILSPG